MRPKCQPGGEFVMPLQSGEMHYHIGQLAKTDRNEYLSVALVNYLSSVIIWQLPTGFFFCLPTLACPVLFSILSLSVIFQCHACQLYLTGACVTIDAQSKILYVFLTCQMFIVRCQSLESYL